MTAFGIVASLAGLGFKTFSRRFVSIGKSRDGNCEMHRFLAGNPASECGKRLFPFAADREGRPLSD